MYKIKVTLINILNVSLLNYQISPVETRSARKQLSDNYTISQGSPDTAHHGAGSQAVATNKTSLIASLQNVLRLFLCFRQLKASTFYGWMVENIFEKISIQHGIELMSQEIMLHLLLWDIHGESLGRTCRLII